MKNKIDNTIDMKNKIDNTIDMKNKIDNTIEWIDKRLRLMGEGLTDKQKEYISFAFNMLMDTPPISPEDKKQMSGGFVNIPKEK